MDTCTTQQLHLRLKEHFRGGVREIGRAEELETFSENFPLQNDKEATAMVSQQHGYIMNTQITMISG